MGSSDPAPQGAKRNARGNGEFLGYSQLMKPRISDRQGFPSQHGNKGRREVAWRQGGDTESDLPTPLPDPQ